jgi:hypothetical protein
MRRAFRDKLPFGNFPHGGQTPADGTVAGKARKNAIRLGFVAAPMADEPCDNEGDQPDATDPQKVMPHRRVSN